MRQILLSVGAAIAVALTLLNPAPAHAELPPGLTAMRIVLDQLPAQVTYGSALTIGGKLEAQVAGVWQPVAGEEVWVRIDSTTWQVPTASDGHFIYKTAVHGPVEFNFSYLAYVVPEVKASYRVTSVPGKTTLKMTKLALDSWGNISASGTGGGTRNWFQKKMELQRRTGKNAWTTIKKVNARQRGGFKVAPFYYGWSGEYRWRYPGGKDFSAVASPAKRVSRWATSFTGVKASPRTVRYRNTTTISGTLKRWGKVKGKAKKYGYANRKVRLLFNCSGDGTDDWYTNFGWTRTDSKGRFKKRVKGLCTGQVEAVFYAGAGMFSAVSKPAPLKVTGSGRTRMPLSPLSGGLPR